MRKPKAMQAEDSQVEMVPFKQRAEEMLCRVYGGRHHVRRLKDEGRFLTCLHGSDLATFDFDHMTRLVLGAHEYCLRVSVSNGGPNQLKIWVWDRKREGRMSERHPTIEQAMQSWENV